MLLNNALKLGEPVLLSELIVGLMNEKAGQFPESQVLFQTRIADKAQFAFARLPLDRITGAIVLLLDSALLNIHHRGRIKVSLDADADTVTVAIQDNGCGMNFEKLDKMLNRENYPHGKDRLAEFGMAEVWSLLEQYQGVLNVDTLIGDGTSVEITFPRVAVPAWMATRINLTPSSRIVILDQDEAVHKQWQARFDIYPQVYPDLRIHYFNDARVALDFILGLPVQEMAQLVLLSEYDLPDPPPDGLQLIEIARIYHATLVTRQFSSGQLQRDAAQRMVTILPMHMIPLIPICFDS